MNKIFSKNLAIKLDEILTESSHDWQYCFLKRGGDAGEIYLSPRELLESSIDIAKTIVDTTLANSNIILLIDHGPKFLIALLACIFAQRKAIPAPIPRFGLNSQRLGKILNLCDDAFVLTQNKHLELVKSTFKQEGFQHDSRILSLESLESKTKNGYINSLPGFSTEINTPVIIQFTSGSTSHPKGVMISSENILANHDEVATRWKFHRDKTLLNWLPYFHDMGLFGGLLYPLLSGQRIVQMDPLHFIQKPQRWLSAISKFRVNFSGGPAFAYDLCNELKMDSISKNLDLSSLEVAFCGADYVPSSTMKSFREIYSSFNLNPSSVIPVYGLAEATLFVAGQLNITSCEPHVYEGNLTEGCYLGEPINSTIEIRDLSTRNVIKDGEIGEICILGKSVSQGYYKESNFSNFPVLKTGDLGFIRNEYLFVCGRIKDVIIKYGQNISPSDIEQTAATSNVLLNPHAAAAFQMDSADGDIVLLIEIKKKANGLLQNQQNIRSDIIQSLQKRMGVSLSKILFLKRGELMRTSSGKVQRQTVAKNFQLGHKFKEASNVNY